MILIKFLAVEDSKKVVFSLPAFLVEESLNLIKIICHYVGNDVADLELLKILEFAFHNKNEDLVFFANSEGVVFVRSTVSHQK